MFYEFPTSLKTLHFNPLCHIAVSLCTPYVQRHSRCTALSLQTVKPLHSSFRTILLYMYTYIHSSISMFRVLSHQRRHAWGGKVRCIRKIVVCWVGLVFVLNMYAILMLQRTVSLFKNDALTYHSIHFQACPITRKASSHHPASHLKDLLHLTAQRTITNDNGRIRTYAGRTQWLSRPPP